MFFIFFFLLFLPLDYPEVYYYYHNIYIATNVIETHLNH